MGTTFDPATFDPYVISGQNTATSANMHSYLIDYAPYTLDVLPDAAVSCTITNHDTITVRLRPNCVFHSGSPVNADALINGLQRAESERISGFDGVGGMIGSRVKSFSKVDDLTVRMVWDYSTTDAIIYDTLVRFPMVDPAVNNVHALLTKDGGMGPFRLVSHQPNESVNLARFEKYWQPGRPYLDTLTYTIFGDEESMVTALRSGAIDGITQIAVSLLPGVGHGYKLVNYTDLGWITLLVLNAQRPPFNNKLIRQMMARALDRERILKEVNGGYGYAVVQPFDPTWPGYDAKSMTTFGYDLDAAAKLFAQAGKPSTPGTAIIYGEDPYSTAIWEILQADLKKIGFTLQIKPLSADAWNAQVESGNWEAWTDGIDVNYKSGVNSRVTSPEYFPNDTNFCWGKSIPKNYVTWMNELPRVTNPAEYEKISYDIGQLLLDESWIIGVGRQPQLYVVDENVQGFAQRTTPSQYEDCVNTWIS